MFASRAVTGHAWTDCCSECLRTAFAALDQLVAGGGVGIDEHITRDTVDGHDCPGDDANRAR